MSKIIKPHEYPEVTAFDFREIERSETVCFLRNGMENTPVGEDDTPRDPLVELERTIQKRLAEAERKAMEIEREAYEKGYAQGQKDGVEYGRKSMEIIKDRMEELLGGVQALPEKAFKDYREWFLTTCLEIARRIVGREMTAQPDALVQLIDSLLVEAEASQSMTLYLNPSDLDMIKKNTSLHASIERPDRTLTFKPDPQLARGGCKLESEIQLLDASIEARFALLEEALYHHGPDS